MGGNESLKDLHIDVNANVETNTRFKTDLKELLEKTNIEADTKKALEPLVADIKADAKFDERLESDVNKKHVTALLTSMKQKLDSDGYTSVYQNYKSIVTFAVQSALRIMGFDLPKENIDGKYGEETADAVEAFQKWQGLKPDRKAGPLTIAKMLEVGLDTKYDGIVQPTTSKEDVEMNEKFYATHEVYEETEFGGVKHKFYKVENYKDIPLIIKENTIIDYGSYYLFSNGRVIEYSADGQTVVRRGDRNELDENGEWKTQIMPVVPDDKKSTITPDKKTPEIISDEITADNMTVDQLQVNIDGIWKKYFTFNQQWQKDYIAKRHLDDGISIEDVNNQRINVRSKGSSYYYLSLNKDNLLTPEGKINTKEFIKQVKNHLVMLMENNHYSSIIEDKIDNTYPSRDKIFTKEELADTTSAQGKKIHEFIADFKQNGPTVDVIKQASQYRINRANGKVYFDYTFKTKNKALWNENKNVVDVANIINEKGGFSQKKWNTELRNIILQKKLTHPYFTKYDTVQI